MDVDFQLHVQSVPIPTKAVSLNPAHVVVYSMQHYVIKFVIDLRQVGGFLLVSSTNKTDRCDITEILLKVALNTITSRYLRDADSSEPLVLLHTYPVVYITEM